MRRFFFLRHGETDWNRANRLQGQTKSVPLNETGKLQAVSAAELLVGQPIDLIVSSTLDRTSMTAQIIADRTGLPVIYDERLIERSLGAAEGKTVEEILALDPALFPPDLNDFTLSILMLQPEGAETREALAERAYSALSDLFEKHQGARLLIVSHGGWLKALIHRLTNTFMRMENARPYQAQEALEGWKVKPLD